MPLQFMALSVIFEPVKSASRSQSATLIMPFSSGHEANNQFPSSVNHWDQYVITEVSPQNMSFDVATREVYHNDAVCKET